VNGQLAEFIMKPKDNTLKTRNEYFFSIIIPTHNRPDMLARALESVMRQDFNDLEIIVVNDGSTTCYNDVLQEYASTITQYHVNPCSQGASAARNIGINLATGMWTFFLDDDDEIAPDYLIYVKNHIQQHNLSNAFLWSWVRKLEYDHSGEKINEFTLGFPKNIKNLKDLYNEAWTIGASYGLVVHRQAYEKVGYYDTAFKVGEDTDFVVRMLSSGIQPVSLPVIGMIKHDHTNERLSQFFNVYSNLKTYERICAKSSVFLQSNPLLHKRILVWTSKVHYRNKNYIAGDAVLRKMITMLPLRYGCIKMFTECLWIRVTQQFYHYRDLKSAAFPSKKAKI
jgi:glycosyltransferase involved in cell wall biosynthesis